MKRKKNKPTERKVQQIIITNNVIRLGSLVIPLTSVSQIEVHRIRKKNIWVLLLILSILGIVGFSSFGFLNSRDSESQFAALVGGLISGILLFLIGRFMRNKKYALRIQSYTGQEDFVTSTDETFLEELADEIHYAMEHSGHPIQVVANIKNKTINKNKNENIMGDKIVASEKSNVVKNMGDGKVTGVGNFSVGNDGNIELEKTQDSFNTAPSKIANAKESEEEVEQEVLKNELRQQLAKNQIEDVLQKLMGFFQKKEKKEAIKTTILIQSRLQRIQLENNMGVANATEVTLHKTKIIADLLDVIDQEF